MSANFERLSRTNSVREAQNHYYGASEPQADPATPPDDLTPEEIDFIQARDSFYMATISENGWPYIQHRGGPIGFLRVLDPRTLAFADYRGNRQMLSTGNLAVNDRVALFLMDYPQRTRLKILGHATVRTRASILTLSSNWLTPKTVASSNVYLSSKSSASTGIVPPISRPGTLRRRSRKWLHRSNSELLNLRRAHAIGD